MKEITAGLIVFVESALLGIPTEGAVGLLVEQEFGKLEEVEAQGSQPYLSLD